MIIFCDLNGLRNLINVPTCYKNFDNAASIDLILTNRPSYYWSVRLPFTYYNRI